MSLNQLTANYTDSEGEDENPKNISISSDDYHISESKDAAKETPNSMESRESSGNTPKKAVSSFKTQYCWNVNILSSATD